MAEYVSYLQASGVEDAQSYADEVFAEGDAEGASGFGGNCGCGS